MNSCATSGCSESCQTPSLSCGTGCGHARLGSIKQSSTLFNNQKSGFRSQMHQQTTPSEVVSQARTTPIQKWIWVVKLVLSPESHLDNPTACCEVSQTCREKNKKSSCLGGGVINLHPVNLQEMAIGSHLNKMRGANAQALAKLTFFNICNSLGHPHPYNENPPAAQNLLRHIYVSFPGSCLKSKEWN